MNAKCHVFKLFFVSSDLVFVKLPKVVNAKMSNVFALYIHYYAGLTGNCIIFVDESFH